MFHFFFRYSKNRDKKLEVDIIGLVAICLVFLLLPPTTRSIPCTPPYVNLLLLNTYRTIQYIYTYENSSERE